MQTQTVAPSRPGFVTGLLLSFFLFMPTGSRAGDAIELPSAPYDHLACYKVAHEPDFGARVRIQSLFEELDLPGNCRLMGRARNFCAPVRKTVEALRYRKNSAGAPIDMPGDHQREGRICYKIKCASNGPGVSLDVEDQFGRSKLRDLQIRRLCTNARIVGDPPPPTTTTTTLPPIDPCALVDCAEGHFCRPDCEDPRSASCVAYAEEGDSCGGFTPPCNEDRCGPDLQCSYSPEIDDAPGVCISDDYQTCTTDSDCGRGEVCVSATDHPFGGRVCVGGCRDDSQCPGGGQCLPTPCFGPPCASQCTEPFGCETDEDCGEGRVCEPGGPNNAGDVRNLCVAGCHEDEQCDKAQTCIRPVCFTTPCPGFCAPEPPGECGDCLGDEGCGEGFRCAFVDRCLPSCECPECDVCTGQCVPARCGDCVSDADCGEEQRCSALDDCVPSCDCPLCAVCSGFCGP